ncbi:hypothetical protein ACFX2C_014314 [Malus domestica]
MMMMKEEERERKRWEAERKGWGVKWWERRHCHGNFQKLSEVNLFNRLIYISDNYDEICRNEQCLGHNFTLFSKLPLTLSAVGHDARCR